MLAGQVNLYRATCTHPSLQHSYLSIHQSKIDKAVRQRGWEVVLDVTMFLLFNARGCANAIPHYQKLRTRVTHIWGNRKRQPNRSALVRPLLGRLYLLELTDLKFNTFTLI